MIEKEFTFPPQEELEKVIKRMIQPGYRRINKGLKPNASTKDRIKYNLCKSIVRHAIKNNLTEEELKKRLDIDQVQLEYILFCHINELTVSELTSYIDSLNIPLEVKVINQYDSKKPTTRAH